MTAFQGNRCETCKYWLAENPPKGLCRRHPPQVVAWLDPKPTNPKEPVRIDTQFPGMLASGWCGEHKAIG